MIFMTIDFDHIRLYELDKEEIMDRIMSGVFKKQHGGNKANSGTWCYNGPIEKLNLRPICN